MVFSVPNLKDLIPEKSNIFDDATDYVKENIVQFSESVNKYFVAPHDNYGIGGFLFDISGDYSVNLTSEITDHVIEDNSNIQDHITIKPKKIILKGYVGELVYRDVYGFSGVVSRLTGKLSNIIGLAPNTAKGADKIIGQINSIANKGDYYYNLISNKISGISSIWDFFNVKDQASQTSQQKAFRYFSNLMENKILVSVQTPFEYMPNMAIESVMAIQREESGDISDFTITLKQITKAKVKLVAYNSSFDPVYRNKVLNEDINIELQGRASQQAAPLAKIGRMIGQETSPSADDVAATGIPALNISADDLSYNDLFKYEKDSKGISLP